MNFVQITDKFETIIGEKFDLLEIHFAPYAFGSGTKNYRIRGRNIKIIFDGKDKRIKIQISPFHEKYPTNSWETIYSGTSTDFFDKGIKLIREKINY